MVQTFSPPFLLATKWHGPLSFLEIVFMSSLQGFLVSPLVSSDDLGPPPKPTLIFFLTWQINISSLKSIHQSYLQFFGHLTSGDLKWPQTSKKLIKTFLTILQIYTPSVKSINHCYLEIRCFQAVHKFFSFTSSGDPRWSLIFTKK